MGSRIERTLQEGSEYDERDEAQPGQEQTPEGLGMSDFSSETGGTVMEDKMDRLTEEEKATLKELLGKMV